jgi:hypothetical protein
MGFPIFTHADLPYHFDTIEKAIEFVKERTTQEMQTEGARYCGWSDKFNCYFMAFQKDGEPYLDGEGNANIEIFNLVKVIPNDTYPEGRYITLTNIFEYFHNRAEDENEKTT